MKKSKLNFEKIHIVELNSLSKIFGGRNTDTNLPTTSNELEVDTDTNPINNNTTNSNTATSLNTRTTVSTGTNGTKA